MQSIEMYPQMKRIFELDKNFKVNAINMLKELGKKMGDFFRELENIKKF